MRHVLTALLGALVAALAAHIVVATWLPHVITEHYPASIARLYSGKSGVGKREEVAHLEPIPGRPGISSVRLLPLAVAKLGIETAVIAVEPVERSRRISGVVLAGPGLPASAPAAARASVHVVAVPLSGRSDEPAPDGMAEILPLGGHTAQSPGKPVAKLAAKPAGIAEADLANGRERTAYYVLPAGSDGLEPGDHVTVKVPLARNGAPASVLPVSAVLYEPNGSTWVYANPLPNTFVREQLQIEFMQAGRAVIRTGPPPGSRIVTVGAFELYGAESSIGIEKVGR